MNHIKRIAKWILRYEIRELWDTVRAERELSHKRLVECQRLQGYKIGTAEDPANIIDALRERNRTQAERLRMLEQILNDASEQKDD